MKKLLLLSLLATAGAVVSSAAEAQETAPVLKDLQACYSNYGTPTETRIGDDGQEEAYVLSSYEVVPWSTGWEPIGTDHRRSTLAKRSGLCYQWMGTWASPFQSGRRADIERMTSQASYHNLAGGTWTFGPGLAKSHMNRFPLVWPSSQWESGTRRITDGVLIRKANGAPVYGTNNCEVEPLNLCHKAIEGAIALDNHAVTSDSGWHGVRVWLKELEDASPCRRKDVRMSVIRTRNISAYQNFNSGLNFCIVVAKGSFDGAVPQHKTDYDGLQGTWVPCSELSPVSRVEAGCDSSGLDDGGEDDGGENDDPMTPPPVVPPGQSPDTCVWDCDPGTNPVEDPADYWIPGQLPPPMVYCGDPSIDPNALAYEFAMATVGPNQSAEWYAAYNQRFNEAVEARDRVCVAPTVRSPSYPPEWTTPEGLEVIHEVSWDDTHRWTGDSQHTGVTAPLCAAQGDSCAEHPRVRIICEDARCNLGPNIFFGSSQAGYEAGGYRIDIDRYYVQRVSLISRWVDGRTNPLHPDHFDSFRAKTEFDSSPPKQTWQALDDWNNRWSQGMAVDGFEWTNATTGGYSSSMTLGWLSRVWLAGEVHGWSYDAWNRRQDWVEPFVIEADVIYQHGNGVEFDNERGMTIGGILR